MSATTSTSEAISNGRDQPFTENSNMPMSGIPGATAGMRCAPGCLRRKRAV